MQAEQPQAEELLLVDQVAQVGAREARARGARAALVEWARIAGKAGIPKVEPALPGQSGAGARGASRQHTVEHVDPALDHLEDAFRVADSHEVARLAGGQARSGPADGLEHLGAVLADREATERVAVEIELG